MALLQIWESRALLEAGNLDPACSHPLSALPAGLCEALSRQPASGHKRACVWELHQRDGGNSMFPQLIRKPEIF